MLATLGPLSDEIIVYPARTRIVVPDDDQGSVTPSVSPCPATRRWDEVPLPGERSTSAVPISTIPLGSRFEEMDAVVFFNNVLVPWERVFLLQRRGTCANTMGLRRTNRNAHTGHQVVTKNVVKCEFMLGLATLMVTRSAPATFRPPSR